MFLAQGKEKNYFLRSTNYVVQMMHQSFCEI